MQCPLQALPRGERNIRSLRKNMCCYGDLQLLDTVEQHVGVWGNMIFPAIGRVLGKPSGVQNSVWIWLCCDVINLLQKSLLVVERMEEFCAKLFLFHFHQGTDFISKCIYLLSVTSREPVQDSQFWRTPSVSSTWVITALHALLWAQKFCREFADRSLCSLSFEHTAVNMTEEKKEHIMERNLLFWRMVDKAYVQILVSVFEFLCSCVQVLL